MNSSRKWGERVKKIKKEKNAETETQQTQSKHTLNITNQNPYFSLPQIKAEISKLLLQTPTQASRECEIKSQISIS